jgi:alkylation response protein AidB-like acyl-CoA dehydrogenase
VRFAFSDEQRQFQRTMRDLLARACPPAEVRAAWASDSGRSPARWAQLAEVGVVGLSVPADRGGLGGDALDWLLPLEEAGRAALPEPLLETTAVAAPLLAAVAPTSEWLPRIADGRSIVTVGIAADSPLVADAHVAELLLLRDGNALHALPHGRARIAPRRSVDGARRLFTVEWTPTEATLLTADAVEVMADAADRGALAAAAMLLGLGTRMLEMTVEYVKVRKQFGQAVGSFQAVKHQLADALVGLELARPLVYHGAYALARRQPDHTIAVAMAKAAASDAALRAGRAALQCHGAIGYSFEHDLHLYLKRAWALAAAWGDAPSQRARVAAHLLDTPSDGETT